MTSVIKCVDITRRSFLGLKRVKVKQSLQVCVNEDNFKQLNCVYSP